MREGLEAFLNVVRRETAVQVSLPPPAARPETLPAPLAAFYGVVDGLDLPFIEIYPSSEVKDSGVPGWLMFGADPYFSFCLCRTSAPWDLDLWDHESGEPPEGGLADVVELLQTSYDAMWRHGFRREGHVVLQAVPSALSLAAVVADLKSIGPAPSAALLAGLKRLPLEIASSKAEAAIQVVRRLHSRGVQCHWKAG